MTKTKPNPLITGALSGALAVLTVCAALQCGGVRAQTAGVPQAEARPDQAPAPVKKKSKNPTGSPLDTLMSTRLFADVPEAKDFVRQSRPAPETLDFQPTAATDPERPKVRTKAELDALQSELESAARSNQARGGQRKSTKPFTLAGAQGSRQAEAKKPLAN